MSETTETQTPVEPEAPTAPPEPEPAAETPAPAEPEHSPAETRDSSQMFEFSRYVHIGPAAETCPDAENGRCNNPLHFHVWIRLPNQFQTASLREKSDAAKARKIRVLRDPESDSRIILDAELEEMMRANDREGIIAQVVNADFLKDHLAAMQEVQTEDEFKTIEEDRERLRALSEQPEDERPKEEFDELEKHVSAYIDQVNAEREKAQQPLRDSLEDKGTEELVELLREQRIQQVARDEADEMYSRWEWYICTLKPRDPQKGLPVDRVWGSIDHMMAAAPEVIGALAVAFRDIEAAAGRSLQRIVNG